MTESNDEFAARMRIRRLRREGRTVIELPGFGVTTAEDVQFSAFVETVGTQEFGPAARITQEALREAAERMRNAHRDAPVTLHVVKQRSGSAGSVSYSIVPETTDDD